MSITRDTKSNFSTGLISQALSQRKNVEGVSDALLLADNFNIRATGSAYFREGLEFSGEISGDGSLIPFDFNNNDGVMMVFTDLKIEFVVDGSFIEKPVDTRYSVISPYLESEVNQIKFVRFYNDMYLFHENHNPKKIERIANDDWIIDDVSFNPDDIEQITNLSITKYSGDVTTGYDWEYAVSVVDKNGRVGFPVEATSVGLDIDLQKTPALINFDPPVDLSNVSKYYVFRKDGGVFAIIGTLLEDGVVPSPATGNVFYERTGSPDINKSPINLNGSQDVYFKTEPKPVSVANQAWYGSFSFDTYNKGEEGILKTDSIQLSKELVSLAPFPGFAPKLVISLSSDGISNDILSSSYGSFSLGGPSFEGKAFDFVIRQVYNSGTGNYDYTIQYSTDNKKMFLQSSPSGDFLTIENPEKAWVTDVSTSNANPLFIQNTREAIVGSDGVGGFLTGNIYNLNFSVIQDGSFLLNPNTLRSSIAEDKYELIDANIPENSTIQPPIRFTDFDGTGNKPRCAAFYGQRLVYAGTSNSPSRIWFSGTGNFTDMTNSNAQLDTEAFQKDILSEQSSVISNLVNFGSLFIGSRDTLWSGNGFTEETVTFVPSDFDGASDVSPVKTKFSLVYVDKNNFGIHDFIYSQETNFDSQDLSLKVEDFFEDKEIVDLGFARSPDPTIYSIMNDGTAMVLLYIKDQGLSSWTRMITDGEFKNVASLGRDKGDHTYFIIKRGEKYFVERIVRSQITGAKVEDSKNVDSFIFKEEKEAFTEVDGLDHLEGKEVWVVYDGNSRKETVECGHIHLPKEANKCCVGIPYEGYFETVQVDYQDLSSANVKSTQDISKRINSVWVRFKNAKAFEVSTDGGKKFNRQKLTDIDKIGLTTELQTGTVKIPTSGNINKDTTIMIRQVEPFPTIIQGLTYKINVGNG